MRDTIQFANNLKLLRKKNGLTRRDLAAKIGYTDKAIEKWEAGISQPPLAILCQIADILGVRLEALVFERHNEIRYFLGIDGGGTKTAFVLENAGGEIIAACKLGASNPNDVGLEHCADVMRTGILQVTAGIDRREVAVFAGLAGGISGDNPSKIHHILSQMEFGFVSNGSDVDNALEVCLQGQDGVAVITGTGSVAFAQKQEQRFRVGGWGYLLDNGGSGYNLGRDALDAAYRALDGRGPKTMLSALLEARLQKSLEKAIPELYSSGKRLIASLAPAVLEACDAGDGVAIDIVKKNTDYIAELILCAAQYLDRETIPVVICGGLTCRADLLEPLIKNKLPTSYQLRFCTAPIVTGAVMCARRKYAQYRETK